MKERGVESVLHSNGWPLLGGGFTVLKLQFDTQQLCMDLLHADTEEQVIKILKQQGIGMTQTSGNLMASSQETTLPWVIRLIMPTRP